MIFWVTVKKVNEKRLNRLNVRLERYVARSHALLHEISTYIYIYIDFILNFYVCMLDSMRHVK